MWDMAPHAAGEHTSAELAELFGVARSTIYRTIKRVNRMARGDALLRRHIEANPQAISNLLVVDIDHPDSALRALSASGSHPMPTAIVENTRNGHAHAVWALSTPVCRTEYGRRRPLAYAAAVSEGLRRAVDGDRGYSGLMTKNPVHDSWTAHWLHPGTHGLDELTHELGAHMPPPRWRQTKQRRENPGVDPFWWTP